MKAKTAYTPDPDPISTREASEPVPVEDHATANAAGRFRLPWPGMCSLDEARRLLGAEGEGMSEAEVARARHEVYALAKLLCAMLKLHEREPSS
jgi:hypothetical protein